MQMKICHHCKGCVNVLKNNTVTSYKKKQKKQIKARQPILKLLQAAHSLLG